MCPIRDAVNNCHFESYKDALCEIKRKRSNTIILKNGLELKFHLKLRGFVVVGEMNTVNPVCPVKDCPGYSAGGHSCTHFLEFVNSLGKGNFQVRTREQGVQAGESVIVRNKGCVTEKAFQDFLTKIGKKVNVDYSTGTLLRKDDWAAILKWLRNNGETAHCFEGVKIQIKFSKNGQLYYKNVSSNRWNHKCPLTNCLMTVQNAKIEKFNTLPSVTFLCKNHQNSFSELCELITLVGK